MQIHLELDIFKWIFQINHTIEIKTKIIIKLFQKKLKITIIIIIILLLYAINKIKYNKLLNQIENKIAQKIISSIKNCFTKFPTIKTKF